MDSKKALLIYQHSERIKSELIIASRLLSEMSGLENKERAGAERLVIAFLEVLAGEIRIAQGVERSVNFLGAEKKMVEAVGRIKLCEYSKVERCISDALSLITTACEGAMKTLIDYQLM